LRVFRGAQRTARGLGRACAFVHYLQLRTAPPRTQATMQVKELGLDVARELFEREAAPHVLRREQVAPPCAVPRYFNRYTRIILHLFGDKVIHWTRSPRTAFNLPALESPMNFKLPSLVIAFGLIVSVSTGCAVDANQETSGDDTGAREDMLTAPSMLVGKYDGNSTISPRYTGIEFKANGTFVADIDTGIRCITTPCPSAVHLEGVFSASAKTLKLAPAAGKPKNATYHRDYSYSLNGSRLVLSSNQLSAANRNWSNSFNKVSGATLWSGGTKLTAQSSGGFGPPVAPGSNCTPGFQVYSYDTAAGTLRVETCPVIDFSRPLLRKVVTKTLTSKEALIIEAAANKLTVVAKPVCIPIFDAPTRSLEITNPGGTKRYSDTRDACGGNGVYVNDIGSIFTAMESVAGEPCGSVTCGSDTVCCNPLASICTPPGQACIQ
jgi:hypothetical protein